MNRIFVVALLVGAYFFVFSPSSRSDTIRFGRAAAYGTTTAQAPNSAKTSVDPSQETRRWEIKPSDDLKGAKGRLVVNFHDEVPMAHMLVKIESKDGGEPVSERKRIFDLLPGNYDVVVAGKRITNLPIQSGKETRLLMGLLRVVYNDMSRTEVYDSDKKTLLVKDNGTLRLGLPIGKYWVKLAGRMVEVEIKDGQVVEF